MTVSMAQSPEVAKILDNANGFLNDQGNPRLKTIVHRILLDTVKLIEDLDIRPEEFWKAVNYLSGLGMRQEAGLLVAGLGLEHYLDLRLDAEDEQAGVAGGTPRTIEGPLYVAGAPVSKHEARSTTG